MLYASPLITSKKTAKKSEFSFDSSKLCPHVSRRESNPDLGILGIWGLWFYLASFRVHGYCKRPRIHGPLNVVCFPSDHLRKKQQRNVNHPRSSRKHSSVLDGNRGRVFSGASKASEARNTCDVLSLTRRVASVVI